MLCKYNTLLAIRKILSIFAYFLLALLLMEYKMNYEAPAVEVVNVVIEANILSMRTENYGFGSLDEP